MMNDLKILADCGVPPHWRPAALGRCADTPISVIIAANEWLSRNRRLRGVFFLAGIPGSGKTWIACGMLREAVLSRDYLPGFALYMHERNYLDRIKASFGNSSPTYSPHSCDVMVLRYRNCPILLYDDLGASRLTDWAIDRIADLLEWRHAHDLPTIITSNLGMKEIADQIDQRIASRISEDGRVIRLPDRDLRRTGSIKPEDGQ